MNKTIITDEKGNRIFGKPLLKNSTIRFIGEDNILYFESDDTRLENSSILFKGNNSTIVIGKNGNPLKINIITYFDCAVYLGRNLWTTNVFQLNAGESKNILIGDDCLISSQCYARTTDSHLIYSINTLRRINEGRSIYIGDHVWICQGVGILKGSLIYSGSIIGAHSIVAGQEILSNSMWAGIPAKLRKCDVFFISDGTHNFRNLDIENFRVVTDEEKAKSFIFEADSSFIPFEDIEERLCNVKSAFDRLYLLKDILNCTDKNRFAKK